MRTYFLILVLLFAACKPEPPHILRIGIAGKDRISVMTEGYSYDYLTEAEFLEIFGFAIETTPEPVGHTCPFVYCPFKGLTAFDGAKSDADEGSDGYILDTLHFQYPEASYDELEAVLFKSYLNLNQ